MIPRRPPSGRMDARACLLGIPFQIRDKPAKFLVLGQFPGSHVPQPVHRFRRELKLRRD